MKPLPIHGVDVTAERPISRYRVTVTNGRARITDTVEARSWHCALIAAFNKYGVRCVVVVKPEPKEPAERPQLCLV